MSAVAGPGPSSAHSFSPVIPGSAKGLRIKRRVINVVNPADPEEFSGDSLSMSASMEHSHSPAKLEHSSTPSPIPTPTAYTPSLSEFGPKGILRPMGTPGSGNGVRFFPKNKFRIITPNHSLRQPPTPLATSTSSALASSSRVPPLPPPAPGLFSSLLAITLPMMSPRPKAPHHPNTPHPEAKVDYPSAKADESWEVPGQEGEVSMVESSIMSQEPQQEEIGNESISTPMPVPWDGRVLVHSSPLNLPNDGDSKEISFADELPSREMHVPDDMSNLLNERYSMQDSSFSIFDNQHPSTIPTAFPRNLREVTPENRLPTWLEESETEDFATIRKRLSPMKAIPLESEMMPMAPSTPTPAVHTGSIFADLSAEQANLSWPLRREPKLGNDDADEDTHFHSALYNDLSAEPSVLADLPVLPPTPGKVNSPARNAIPKSSGTPILPSSGDRSIGNKTEFFDCTMSDFDTLGQSPITTLSLRPETGLSLSSTMVPIQTPTPLSRLVQPTKNLFTAQSQHTTALLAEVKLYRDLAEKLHAEVMERDDILSQLQEKALEADSTQVQLSEMTEKYESGHAARRVFSESPSPLASRTPVGDRTTVVQAETRDLEIRLSKALGDLAETHRRQGRIEVENKSLRDQLESSRLEIKDREAIISDGTIEILKLKDDLAHALSAPSVTSAMRREVQDLVSRAQDLEDELTEMKKVRKSDEEEIERLSSQLSSARGSRRREDDLRRGVEELENELAHRAELGDSVRREKEARTKVEAENKELRRTLQSVRMEISDLQRNTTSRQTPTQPDVSLLAEITRLRNESASKDLEIMNLQRRKDELKDDREMLNIALDSKQQELELIKRKFAVKGIAGSTPLPLGSSTRVRSNETPLPLPPASSKTNRRRSSMALMMPSVGPERRTMRSSALIAAHHDDAENRPPSQVRVSARLRIPA